LADEPIATIDRNSYEPAYAQLVRASCWGRSQPECSALATASPPKPSFASVTASAP